MWRLLSRERERDTEREREREREREKAAAKKKEKKLRFWLSHVRKSERSRTSREGDECGSIIRFYMVPGKKATNNNTERHKKEQLNSLSLCLLLTRLAHVYSNTQKSNEEEENDAE